MSSPTRSESRQRPRKRSDVRWVPILAAFVVGAASFTLSFFAQSEVAARLGAVPADLSWLVPVTIDGGILAGSASVWASSSRRAKKDPVAYLTVAALLTLSVVINVHHASAGGGVLGAVIAGTPPVILLLCLELVAAQARRDAREQEETLPVAVTPQADTAPKDAPTQPDEAPDKPVSADTPAPRLAGPSTFVVPKPAPVAAAASPQPAPRVNVTVPTLADEPAAKLNGVTPKATPSTARTTPTPATTPAASTSPPRPEPAAETPRPEKPATATTGTKEEESVQLSAQARQAVTDPELTQAERVRILFQDHLTSGGDAQDPAISRVISETLEAPLPSVRKVISQERKALAATN